jgi:hypothetical protein
MRRLFDFQFEPAGQSDKHAWRRQIVLVNARNAKALPSLTLSVTLASKSSVSLPQGAKLIAIRASFLPTLRIC